MRLPPLEPGVWGVLATPFLSPSLALDEDSLAREVAWFADLGAAGVVALAVSGEATRLSVKERHRVLQVVAAQRGALPVVVGLPALATQPAIEQARLAAEALGDGLAGVMVQVNTASVADLVAHLGAIHAATGVGVVVQDYPLSSTVHIAPAALLGVIQQCAFVVGVKCESPPTAVAIATICAGSVVPLFGGLGGVSLVEELASGAAGAMTGFAYPEGLLAACEAFKVGRFAAAQTALRRWLPILSFEAQPGYGLAIRKELLRRRGIIAAADVRPPGLSLPEAMLPLIDAHLGALAGA